MIATINSVTGNDNHTPTIAKRLDIKKAAGNIITTPLSIDIINAGIALSVDVKYVEITMFKARKGVAKK